MDKLIVNVPSFNKEAIKSGMFIEITHFGNNDMAKDIKIGGIVTKVETDRISYVTSNGAIRTVHLPSIFNGTCAIKVANELEEKDPVNHIIKEASTGTSLGYTRLNIVTQSGNIK